MASTYLIRMPPAGRAASDPPAAASRRQGASALDHTDPADPTDDALLDAIVARDELACAELLRRHAGWAIRFAERLTGSHAIAEEVVQNAFLRVWQQAARWERRSRFSTWFYRIVHNLCVDHLRAQHGSREALDDDLVDEAPTPEEHWHAGTRAARVRAALAQLPERQRAAIVLVHYEDCSQAEAAAVLAISEGALESLLSRGRAALRAHLRAELN